MLQHPFLSAIQYILHILIFIAVSLFLSLNTTEFVVHTATATKLDDDI